MILEAVLILGGVGLVFGVFIAIANKRLWVWEDPRIDVVAQMLPNANCGACGLPGCRAFAEQAVAGKVTPASIVPSADSTRQPPRGTRESETTVTCAEPSCATRAAPVASNSSGFSLTVTCALSPSRSSATRAIAMSRS